MLKKFPLLLILLPFSFASADEIKTDPTAAKNEADEVSEDTPNKARSTGSFFNQCYRNVPPIVIDNNPLPINQIPVNIEARSIRGSENTLTYQDDVYLTQGIKTLKADKLTYFKDQDRATAQGNINFVTGEITLNSDSVETDLASEETTLQQVDYQFHGEGGRGNARRIYDNGADLYELNSSSYSACPPGDNTWSFSSSTLYIDNEEGVASAYNAVLRIKDVPVLYLPYITYPTSDKRKTGLLFPTYEFADTNGFTLTQPLYINIANNMDATLTPVYMENRGTLLTGEYRYLFNFGSGTFAGEYLGDDRIEQEKRYLYHWEHDLALTKNWYYSSEYTTVSDDDYLTDIDTEYGEYTDSQLLQTAKLGFSETNWEAEIEVRDFQTLGTDQDETSHKVLPKIAMNYYQPLGWKGSQLDWYSEVSRFDHSSDNVYTGTRIHLQSKFSLPLYYNAFFVKTELKYMVSFYQQSLPEADLYDWYDDLEDTASRYIPSFKINSGINFERDFDLFNSKFKQTLVPQFQYLYVPYRDQSAIGIYDSSEMEQDYYSLFRDNRFSGYDRIAEANLITFGFSSSILNSQGQEKMHFAIGQNYYFSPSETAIPDDDDDDQSVSGSSIIGDFDINLKDRYFFHSGIEWDADENEIDSANAALEKRWQNNTYAQINYRYISVADDGDDDDMVNQFGSKANWLINEQWTTFASYYYDLEYQHPYETILGLKYESCCWSLGFTYNNYLYSMDTDTGDYETETSYEINFELKGLGGAASGSGGESLFDYGRPFYLQ